MTTLEVVHMADKGKGYRFADLSSTKYIARKLDDLEGIKSQREIGMAVGWPQPAMVSMIKRGEIKVPLDKVPALARAINCDEVHLLRLVMQDHHPELYEALSPYMGGYMSKGEREVLGQIRNVVGDRELELDDNLSTKIRSAFA